jgi:hypothetical protein
MQTWRIEQADHRTLRGLRECQIDLVKGSVDIVTTDDEPSVEVMTVRNGPMQITFDDGTATVGYPKPVRRLPLPLTRLALARREHADVRLRVPPDCRVSVRTVDATVTVSRLAGRLSVDSVCGDINLAEQTGDAELTTGRGLVQSVGGSGDLDVDIHAGDFTLINGDGAKVRARSIHGSHRIDLGSATGPRDLDVSCRVGDVTIRLPQESDLRVELTTVMGEIAAEADGIAVRRKRRGASASGQFGSGAGRLRANADRGRVSLLVRTTERDL